MGFATLILLRLNRIEYLKRSSIPYQRLRDQLEDVGH